MSNRPKLSGGAARIAAGDAIVWAALAGTMLYNHRVLFGALRGRSASGTSLDEALSDPSVPSPVLGLLVFAALLSMRRDRIRAEFGRPPTLGIALPALGLGLALLGWSHAIAAPDLVMPALVLELVGGAAWLGGRALVGAIGFPLLALGCVIPLPAILLNQLLFPLQIATVALTSALLSLVGPAHAVAGDLILTQGVSFQVIEGCSGFKTILSLVLAGVAYAEFVGRRGIEKALIVGLAPAIGFFVNGLRILVLVFRKIPAESAEHQAYGIVAVGFGVLLLALAEIGLSRTVFRCWARRDPVKRDDTELLAAARNGRGLRARLAGWAVASSCLCALLVFSLPGSLVRRDFRYLTIEDLPLVLAGREARGLQVDDAFLGHVQFAHRLYRAYERPGESTLRVFVGLEDAESREFSALSPKTGIPHSGWLALERLGSEAKEGIRRERLAIRYDRSVTGDRSLDPGDSSDSQRSGWRQGPAGSLVLVEHVWLGFAPWECELLRGWLALDRLGSPQSGRRLVIRVEIDGAGDRGAAELSLRQFAQEVVDWYQSAG